MSLKSNKKIFAVLSCTLALCALFAGCKSEEQIAAGVQTASGVRDVIYNEAPEEKMKTIVVKGSGETKVVPDTASITFNISTKDKEAAAAQTQNDEIVKALTDMLLEAGVAKSDIKTRNISMYEQYDYSKNEPVLTGYEASNHVQVTVRKVAELGSLITGAISVGVTSYDNLNFAAADTAAGYDKALALAVEDAARKAEAIAAAAGKTLVNIVTIEEQSVSQAIRYDATNKTMMAAEAAQTDGAAEISTGEITMQAELVATYEIQ